MRQVVLSLIFGLLTALTASAQRKAVFIILDGIPADVIEKAPTPFIKEISSKGWYSRAYQGGEKDGISQSPTVSAVGYNNVLTGTWSHKHHVLNNDIKEPNYHYWNIFRIAKSAKPELKTAVFSSWTDNRTKLLGESLPEAGSIKFDYSYDGLELDNARFPHTPDRQFMFNIDEAVSTEAAKTIVQSGPDLSWVYLEFTDDMGHMFGDSPQLNDAVQKADAQVGRIWNAIKERETKSGEEWMILITTDHGRDEKTGKGHGGQSDRERTTWIATNIKDVNAHAKEIPAAVDIAPSILNFMKIKVPETVSNELDGTAFIGPVSVSHLSISQNGKNVILKWNALSASGKAEVKISNSDLFGKGGTDNYTTVSQVNIGDQTYSFTSTEIGLHKILLVTPENTITGWIMLK